MNYDYLDFFKDKRILITGGTGYIGSSLVQALETASSQLVLLLRENRSYNEDWINKSKVSMVHGDIRVRDTWERALDGVEFVFHLASHENRYGVKPEPVIDLDLNVLPILHLLEICKNSKISAKILFSGSENEVGIAPKIPVNESFNDNPITIFGINKLIAEKYLSLYSTDFGIKTVTLRLSNVYGPVPHQERSVQVVLNKIIRDAIQGEINIYGNGKFFRDFVFISDVINAFLMAGTKMEEISGSHYLIGSGKKLRFIDYVKLIEDKVALKTGKRPKIKYPSPPVEISEFDKRNFVADTSAFNTATNWSPRVSIEDGINQTIEYFLQDLSKN